jgi:hypothetical protein
MIIGVLDNDYVWGGARDLRDVPRVWVERLRHYFETYTLVPGQRSRARVARVYGRAGLGGPLREGPDPGSGTGNSELVSGMAAVEAACPGREARLS